MSKTLYVGNLSLRTSQGEIRQLFEPYGEVMSVDLGIDDRYFGEHRGFGFVKIADQGARKAIAALNRKEVDGRIIRVKEPKPREQRDGGWGGRRSYW